MVDLYKICKDWRTVNIFTKPLSGDRVSYLCNKLGMINIYALTGGEVL